MSNHVYKHIQVTGTSSSSIEEAVETALKKAAKSVHNMRWFEVVDVRGSIEKDHVGEWQITMKIGFTLDD
jgi:hypothetical protein